MGMSDEGICSVRCCEMRCDTSNEVQILQESSRGTSAPATFRDNIQHVSSMLLATQTQKQHEILERFCEDVINPRPFPIWKEQDAEPEPPPDNACADLVVDLLMGLYFTQLTDCGRYADIHCQLTADLKTLNFDLGNGRIIEFPLVAVKKVFRLWVRGNRLSTAECKCSQEVSEHIVMVEFVSRKLAFVFEAVSDAECFMVCIEMLQRRAHQLESMPAHSASQVKQEVVASFSPRVAVGLEERWFSSAFRPECGDSSD